MIPKCWNLVNHLGSRAWAPSSEHQPGLALIVADIWEVKQLLGVGGALFVYRFCPLNNNTFKKTRERKYRCWALAKTPLGTPASHTGVSGFKFQLCSWWLLPACEHPRGQQLMAPLGGSLPPLRETLIEVLDLRLTCLSSGYCGHLRSELTHGRFCISSCFCVFFSLGLGVCRSPAACLSLSPWLLHSE